MFDNLRLHKQLWLTIMLKSILAYNIDIIKATIYPSFPFTSYILIHILFCMYASSQT